MGRVPVTFTVPARRGEVRQDYSRGWRESYFVDLPVFPPAEPATLFQIADGATVGAWRHGTQQAT